MFIFKKVKAQNFLSFKDLELELEDRGLTLIEGINDTNDTFNSNGSGKSSLLSSVAYAIYGQTTMGVKADDVINNLVGKNTSVILEVEVDGQPYRIERYRKHSKHKSTVKLFREDTEITKASVKETDAAIQTLFGIDYQTFTNAIMYGQGEAVTFAQATDKERKEILENVTGIAIYKKAQDIAKEKLAGKKIEISALETQMNLANQELVHLNTLIQSEAASYKYTEDSIKQLQADLTAAQEAYNNVGYAAKETQLEEQLQELRSTLVAPTDFGEPSIEEKALAESILSLETQYQELNRQATTLSASISNYNQTIQTKQREKQTFATGDTCPTCGSKLDNAHALMEVTRLEKEIEQLQSSVNIGSTAMQNQFGPTLSKLLSTAQERRQELKQLEEARTRDAYQEYTNKSNMINSLSQQLKEVKYASAMDQTKIQGIQSQLDMLQRTPVPADRAPEVAAVHAKIADLQTQTLALSTSQAQYENAVDMFSNKGIRSVVLDLVTPFLNERANRYSAILSGADIEIVFKTQTLNKDGSYSDKFSVEVLNAHGSDLYTANSGGERRRIDLAISFAIQDLVLSKEDMQTNIALYDEVFDALDAIGCENTIELLREKQKQIGSIFVITHNESLKALFDNVITVKKEDGVSSIVKG